VQAGSQPPQFPLGNCVPLRRDQKSQRIRRVIPAHSILIRIDFEHILRSIRIVLKRRQRLKHRPHRLWMNTVAATHFGIAGRLLHFLR